MSSCVEDLIESLNRLDWSACETQAEVAHLLKGVRRGWTNVKNFCGARLEGFAHLGAERTTHYKWYLHREPAHGYRIWLHEYKPQLERRPGYAIIPHNHLYWFASFIISGGFTHRIYSVRRCIEDESRLAEIRVAGDTAFRQGAVYTVDIPTIHSLENLAEGTLTLVVQSRDLLTYSESFDAEKQIIRKHYPFSERAKLNEKNWEAV